jgi:hypothetical protein
VNGNRSLRIYIAGPYTADTPERIRRNVNVALDAAITLYFKGHFPFVPHLTHFVDERGKETGRRLAWEDYIRWDTAWLEVSDALLYLGSSRGADIELEEAKRRGKRIFYSLQEIPSVPMPDATKAAGGP